MRFRFINFKSGGKIRFDDRRIHKFLDKKEVAGLNRYGATVAMYARRSMRYAKPGVPAARPGQPPKARRGTIRKMMRYAFDVNTRSVVAGPELFTPASGAPEVLEYGGYSTIKAIQPKAQARKKQDSNRAQKDVAPRRRLTNKQKKKLQQRIRVYVQPRPFMHPPHERLLPKLPQYIAGSVR